MLGWFCQVSVFSSVLSHHNKDLEWRTLKPSAHHSSWILDRPCYSSQTNQCYIPFYLDNSRKIHPRGMKACWPKDAKRTPQHMGERERERALWLLFLYVFSSPLGLPYVNWVSQECCLFYLRSSLRSSDLPLFYFCGLFPSLSLATAILDSCFLF